MAETYLSTAATKDYNILIRENTTNPTLQTAAEEALKANTPLTLGHL